jgi:hypothetical protein
VTKQPLLISTLTAILALAALNLLIGAWSRKLPYYHKLENIRTAQDPDLLFVGNSLLDSHVDEEAFAQASKDAHFKPLNSALGATLPPEQLLLFDYAVQNHPGIRILVLGIYDFQLTEADHSRLMDLTGNRMVGIDRRFPMSEIAAVYNFGPLDKLEIEGLRALPMISNRTNAWKDVELLRRFLGAMGMPPIATNSMGRVADFAALEAGSTNLFDANALAFLDHPDHFNSSYESMFRQANHVGMKVVIVVMPMSPWHRQVFYARPLWQQYLLAIENMARHRGIQVIDTSNWILTDNDFVDHLHMTPQAAHDFSVRLGSSLSGPR